MVTVKEILKHMTLGTSVAEFDEDLENYFVQTNVFHEFINGKKDIVAGDKGTGKTAIFRYINRNFNSLDELNGKILVPAFNATGNPIFNQLVNKGQLSEQEYANLWKFYILSLVGNTILANNTSLHGNKLDKLLSALNMRITEPNPKGVFSKVLQAIPNFFRWKSAEVSFTIGDNGMLAITPKLEFSEEKEADEPVFISAEDALSVLDETLQSENSEVWITFDRLDEAFQGNPDIEVLALRALLRTYLDIADLKNLKMKLFLRRDLFRRVTSGGFVNLTHINSKKIEIIWDEEDLLNLLARRLKESPHFTSFVANKGMSDQQIFDAIFPDQVDPGLRKPKTWVWMMRRIRDGNDVKPPRNLIDLINHSREAQLRKEDRQTREYESGPLIESEALRRGLSVLSESRVNDTLIAESGHLAAEIEKFRGGKAEHNLESLSSALAIPMDIIISAIKPLRDIGFLEETGGTYKIPALYREGLDITQGKAFQDQSTPDDDY